MVGIVLVSHSEKVLLGINELIMEMAKDAKVALAGGTSDGRLGTDMNKIIKAIESVYSNDGVIILFDIGSSLMNAQMALEFLDITMSKNVEIFDCALVEGGIVAALESSIGKNRKEIKSALKKLSLEKM